MKQLKCIGGCLPLFIMAIVFDITGFVLLFVGIFGDIRIRGVFYGDFLIHTGALMLFVSLAFWLMWYIGNIKVQEEGLKRRSSAANSVKHLARKLTERLSKTHLKNQSTGEKSPSKASTIRNITWGKSTYFPGCKDPESDMIKCDTLFKENPNEDEVMGHQNQAYEDEESLTKLQEMKDDQTRGTESEVSKPDEASQDDPFTCYQNEGCEKSESDATKVQTPKPDESSSIDDLLQ
ncbi:uncharacterized protein LOC127653213 [Xyrauchen texanus]|uniref:uncharacterized protein LOC127653213 n=1 Tax=Xyrauchen texanus TaxID=154827 RepID=UPI002241C39A|nr:uncharacterized protein LOC127653213 [Xyrauchen texanus]XP_051995779.1 uncharacterized protein LOC127653213 [Xyrauchen texanus]